MSDWTIDYFERGYLQRWPLQGPSADVRLQADHLWKLLHLSGTSRVVDIGCGHGRHALALAERGAEVFGVDASAALLHRARQLAGELGVAGRWIRGDMRRLPLRSASTSAAILFDAFGFFETDQDDEAVLREAARVTTDGGHLALKVVNGASIIDDFRETDREERDGVVISIANTLTFDPPRLTQHITIVAPQDTSTYERRQRLYRADELCESLENVGWTRVQVLAGLDGACFSPATSTTMWLIAERSEPR